MSRLIIPWLVAEMDGRIAGYVYASRHHERAAYRWSVDVAVYIGRGSPPARRGTNSLRNAVFNPA